MLDDTVGHAFNFGREGKRPVALFVHAGVDMRFDRSVEFRNGHAQGRLERCQPLVACSPLPDGLERERYQVDIRHAGFFQRRNRFGGVVFGGSADEGETGCVDEQVRDDPCGVFTPEEPVERGAEVESAAVGDACVDIPCLERSQQLFYVLHVSAEYRCPHAEYRDLAAASRRFCPVVPFPELRRALERFGGVRVEESGFRIEYRVLDRQVLSLEVRDVTVHEHAEKVEHVFVRSVQPELVGGDEGMDVPGFARNVFHHLADVADQGELALAFAVAFFRFQLVRPCAEHAFPFFAAVGFLHDEAAEARLADKRRVARDDTDRTCGFRQNAL